MFRKGRERRVRVGGEKGMFGKGEEANIILVLTYMAVMVTAQTINVLIIVKIRMYRGDRYPLSIIIFTSVSFPFSLFFFFF